MSGHDRLSVLVHELRSPIAALQAIADAAASGALRSENGPRLVGLAVEAARNIERLVVDPAFMALELVTIDLVELARGGVDTFALAAHAVVLDVGPGDHSAVVDPLRVRQALDNLIGNAVLHSPPLAPVRVSVHDRGDEIAVAVTDEGEGIRAEDQERVFDPGVRLTRARPGSGIGLAVVKAVAAAHGGRIELESALGAGATFRLVLPRDGAPHG